MKFLITTVLVLSSATSFATDYTCEAYCGYYQNGIIIYSDTNGEYVTASGSSKSNAFNEMKEQCHSISKDYKLYANDLYRAWASPSNSCY